MGFRAVGVIMAEKSGAGKLGRRRLHRITRFSKDYER
jgi:hypothetical protein